MTNPLGVKGSGSDGRTPVRSHSHDPFGARRAGLSSQSPLSTALSFRAGSDEHEATNLVSSGVVRRPCAFIHTAGAVEGDAPWTKHLGENAPSMRLAAPLLWLLSCIGLHIRVNSKI